MSDENPTNYKVPDVMEHHKNPSTGSHCITPSLCNLARLLVVDIRHASEDEQTYLKEKLDNIEDDKY